VASNEIIRAVWAAALLAVCSACASTGAVPKPFPMPTPTSGPAPAVPSSTSDPNAPGLPPGPPPERPGAHASAAPGGVDGYALTAVALALRGAPYRDGGADPKGFDCSGFTQYVFAQFGVALPRAVRDQFRMGRSLSPEDLAAGDLIFFSTTEPGVSHVAIAIGGDEFIHAPSSTGVVRVEHLSSSYWAPRYVGARRLK
jgi:cell wall-associated NlpC family hydrolase